MPPNVNGPVPLKRGSPEMDDPLLTVREAAAYLRFRESFIRRLIAERRVDYQKVAGFHVRIRRSSLDALIDTVEAQRPGFSGRHPDAGSTDAAL